MDWDNHTLIVTEFLEKMHDQQKELLKLNVIPALDNISGIYNEFIPHFKRINRKKTVVEDIRLNVLIKKQMALIIRNIQYLQKECKKITEDQPEKVLAHFEKQFRLKKNCRNHLNTVSELLSGNR